MLCGGMTGLLRPDLLLSLLGLPAADPRLFLMACSQASIAMGLYYILSAVHCNREFCAWSIPVRLVNFCVFTGMLVLHLASPHWLAVAGFRIMEEMGPSTGISSTFLPAEESELHDTMQKKSITEKETSNLFIIKFLAGPM